MKPRLRIRYLCLVGLAWIAVLPAPHAAPRLGAIASAHPLATQAGFEILEAGGNAFDAAVAVSAALGVVEPSSSGFGGGGFWLIRRAGEKPAIFIDGRERAPRSADKDMYLDAEGNHQQALSLIGPFAAAVPGQPAALDHIARKYGKLPLARSLEPAIRLAREGFEVDAHYLEMAGNPRILPGLRRYPATAAIFLDKGEAPKPGFRLVQTDLAATIARIASEGRAGFYTGQTAQRLVAAVNAAGGAWVAQDLLDYQVVERQALTGSYRGFTVITSPPPSSGGVALLTALNVLEPFDLGSLRPAVRTHLVIEAMRRAYRDRADYLGDPDFVAIPTDLLRDKAYAAGLRAGIRHDRAGKSDDLPDAVAAVEGTDTTHFSVMDAAGNLVAGTLSINIPFGSALAAAGTGVLLNDEMDDFSSKPGTPNVYGLIGASANAIAPGKRPLSSMTPTVIERDGEVALLGTPGGSRIISMVLLGVLDFTGGNPDPKSWVGAQRYHHQYMPDEVQIEKGAIEEPVRASLREMGHTLIEVERNYGNMQALYWNRATGEARAASDPRGGGLAEVR